MVIDNPDKLATGESSAADITGVDGGASRKRKSQDDDLGGLRPAKAVLVQDKSDQGEGTDDEDDGMWLSNAVEEEVPRDDGSGGGQMRRAKDPLDGQPDVGDALEEEAPRDMVGGGDDGSSSNGGGGQKLSA